MASAQSSQDICRGRGRQPQTLGSPRPRHRSESRRLSDCRRPVKTAAHKRDQCRGALHEGDAICVFSRSAAAWMDGEVVKFFEGNFVRVEYEVGEYWHGKTLHLHSEHLDIPKAMPASPSSRSLTSLEEQDPGCWNYVDMLKHTDTWVQDSAARSLEVLAQKGSQKARIELLVMASSGNTDAHAALERLGNGVVEEVSRPEFLKIQVTPNMKTLQCTEPAKWAMTLNQWNMIVDECKSSHLFQEIKHSKKSFEQFVSVYDINEYFVKPWTREMGCGLALLMNPDGKDAQIMLSHAWGEDIEELHQALNKHFESNGIDKDKAVWFCTFAQYQVEDEEGPSIETQLQLNPFTKVIQSTQVEMMLAVHTTTADLYDRLWCVREVDEALSLEHFTIKAAFSDKYADQVKEQYSKVISSGGTDDDGMEKAGLTVHAARAKCRKQDEQMLLEQLFSREGGFKRIDEAVTAFRRSEVIAVIVEVLRAESLKGKPNALLGLVKKEGNLQAVDLLYEVAEIGEEQAQKALFDALKSIASANEHHMKHGWYSLCWKDRVPAFQLVITLLQTMAYRGHNESFEFLAGFDWKPYDKMVRQLPQEPQYLGDASWLLDNAIRHPEHHKDKLKANIQYATSQWEARNKDGADYIENVDVETWRCQHAELSLQALAQHGNQVVRKLAVDKLEVIARKSKGDNAGKQALRSLAEQWNRQVLKVLKAMAAEEGGCDSSAWARGLLDECKDSLRACFGEGAR